MSPSKRRHDPAERYEALIGVLRAISSRRGEQLFGDLFNELRKLAAFQYLDIGLYDGHTHLMRVRRLQQRGSGEPVALIPEETPIYDAYLSQAPLVIPRPELETRYPKAAFSLQDSSIQSVCVLPLTSSRRQLGGMTFGSENPDAYSTQETEFLCLSASQVAAAIDDCLNFEASELANERLNMLFELNKSIGTNLGLQDLLRAVCDSIRHAMDCHSVIVGLIAEDGKSLEIVARAASGGPGRIHEGLRFPIEGTHAQTLQKVKATAINRLENSGFDERVVHYLTSEGLRSFCYIPLITRSRTLGLLALGKVYENGFTQDDLDFLSQFAGQVAVAVENGLGRQELQRHQMLLMEGERLTRSGSFRWVPSSGEVFWSAEKYRLLGYDPERTKPTYELFIQRVHPEDRARVENVVAMAAAAKRSFEFEFRISRPDGTISFVHDLSEAILNASGELVEYIGTTVDMTERKRAEGELRRSEGRLAEGQRLTHTGTWSRNPVEPFEDVWSQELFRILDLDPATTKPSCGQFMAAVHPDDRAQVDATRSRAVLSRSDTDDEFRVVRPNGQVRYVHACFHPVVSESGELLEYMSTVMDVTEQHHARCELGKAFEEIRALKDRLVRENLALRDEIDRTFMFEEIVGGSRALERVLSRVAKVAPTDSTVLITGETGTGKELVARAIHKRSQRAGRAFVGVNCASLPQGLIATELFGHEKGAFTGATQRRLGRFEIADGGTIFLDEIGDLPIETQLALLRVLQEREFNRVGGSQPIPVDVRVVVSTNRNLQAAIAAGHFRPDLFYRLNVFPIEVPPLRDRKEDIPMLADYFIRHYVKLSGKKIRQVEQRTLELFQSYDWPGNIRELQNIIERSVILCSGEAFSVDESWIRQGVEHSCPAEGRSLTEMLVDQERKAIEAALAASNGRVAGPGGAAAKLGMPQSTLAWRIKVLKIRKN